MDAENITSAEAVVNEETDRVTEEIKTPSTSKIDVAVYIAIAFLTLCTYFFDWYGFFMPEGASNSLSASFGPGGSYGVYGGNNLDIGLISPLFVWANVIIYVCEALLTVVIVVGAVPFFKSTVIPTVVSYVYYGLNLVAVVLGFIGAVGGVDPIFKMETTVNFGWYGALILSLAGLLITAVPDLASRIIKSYKKD